MGCTVALVGLQTSNASTVRCIGAISVLRTRQRVWHRKRYAQDVLIQIIRKAVYKSTAPETLAALPFVARATVVSDY